MSVRSCPLSLSHGCLENPSITCPEYMLEGLTSAPGQRDLDGFVSKGTFIPPEVCKCQEQRSDIQMVAVE